MPAQHRLYRTLWKCARWFPRPSSGALRRPAVGLTAGVLIIAGLAMIILPGPALVVLPLGLVLLASEFICVRRWLRTMRKGAWFGRGTRRRTQSFSIKTRQNP